MNSIKIPFDKLKEGGVTVLGSSNIDLFLYVDEFPKDGETIHANKLTRNPGGKGSNQGVMISRLSTKEAKNIFIGNVGDDSEGQTIINNYKKAGFVDVDKHVRIMKGTNSGHASIYVNQRGSNRIILDYGANGTMTKEQIDESFKDAVSNTKVFLTQFEQNLDVVKYAVEKSKKSGLFTIVNPAPAKVGLPQEFYKNIDLIIPNESESETLLSMEVHNVDDAVAASKRFQKFGCKNVIITMGSQGCVVLLEGETEPVHVSVPIKVKCVDTTGAGDSFCGSLAYFLSCGVGMMDAVKWSTYMASLSVQVSGKGCQGSYPRVDEKREKLEYIEGVKI